MDISWLPLASITRATTGFFNWLFALAATAAAASHTYTYTSAAAALLATAYPRLLPMILFLYSPRSAAAAFPRASAFLFCCPFLSLSLHLSLYSRTKNTISCRGSIVWNLGAWAMHSISFKINVIQNYDVSGEPFNRVYSVASHLLKFIYHIQFWKL